MPLCVHLNFISYIVLVENFLLWNIVILGEINIPYGNKNAEDKTVMLMLKGNILKINISLGIHFCFYVTKRKDGFFQRPSYIFIKDNFILY